MSGMVSARKLHRLDLPLYLLPLALPPPAGKKAKLKLRARGAARRVGGTDELVQSTASPLPGRVLHATGGRADFGLRAGAGLWRMHDVSLPRHRARGGHT